MKWNLNSCSGTGEAGKKFQFFPKVINNPLDQKQKHLIIFPEQVELIPPHVLTATNSGSGSATAKLPAWKKLPASNRRSPQLTELITGMQFASIAAEGDADLDTWFSRLPGMEVCNLSIDMSGERAERFLRGENGRTGTTLYRDFLRALERANGATSLAAIWVRPQGAPADAVRLFMTIRMASMRTQYDAATVDSCHRFHRSLIKHNVPCGAPGKPVRVEHADMAAYLGMTEDEWYWEREKTSNFDPNALGLCDLWEYTPETGFASAAEIASRAGRSYARWNNFLSTQGLPQWFDESFAECLMDHFIYSEDEVRERDQARARMVKRKNLGKAPAPADVAIDRRFKNADIAAVDSIRIFRGSPAQFAAHAVRSGDAIGNYCCSEHKAGAAKVLYELVRQNQINEQPDPTVDQ